MNLIKLNAIDSTNSFLKEMARKTSLKNYTVVSTNEQTKGRGQFNSSWSSEPSKNLTISVFIKDFNLAIANQKYLNFAISLAVFDVLYTYLKDTVSIKWPNDILSVEKKICGILIENSIQQDKINHTIVGIGLNVNQENFSNDLIKVTSLKLATNREFNLDNLLLKLIESIKKRISQLSSREYEKLELEYLNALYKKDCQATFIDHQNNLFIGKIIGISETGKLQIKLDENRVKEFGIKEVSFA